MALSDFQKNVGRNVFRQGSVFVRDGSVWRDLGQVKDVNLEWEPVVTDADTAGRQKQLAADVTFTFVMQQTSDTEIANLTDIIAGGALANGLRLKITNAIVAVAGAEAATGINLMNALPVISGKIDFNGGAESMLTVECKGRVSITQLTNLGKSVGSYTLTFDA
jgi:hypothetical protein